MVIVGYRLIIMFLPPLTSAYSRNSDTWELYIPGYSNLDNISRSSNVSTVCTVLTRGCKCLSALDAKG